MRDSNATQNGDHGIFTTVGCSVSNSTAQANGFDGIVASGGSLVIGNTARVNGRFGLLLSGTDGYGNNVLTGNSGDLDQPNAQALGGVQMGHNICNGAACP